MKIVEIEYTPNPNAVKFILSEALTPMGSHAEFHSAEEAEDVPLAASLFEIEHVTSVYWTDRWLTVTQDGDANWHELLREVATPIREATREDAALGEGWEEKMQGEGGEDIEGMGLDDERMPAIREILEEEILPFLQGDGGGLEIKGLVDNQLFIRYQGACGTCPSATMGTLLAIENLIQMEVDPELTVVSVDGGMGMGAGQAPSIW
jgi:Fe-S cluster biogenesis protein NfuA